MPRKAIRAESTMLVRMPGLARMYRGMHHPTDVAAGLLIGAGSLVVAVAAARAAGAAARKGASA